jgi:hypothetical protein
MNAGRPKHGSIYQQLRNGVAVVVAACLISDWGYYILVVGGRSGSKSSPAGGIACCSSVLMTRVVVVVVFACIGTTTFSSSIEIVTNGCHHRDDIFIDECHIPCTHASRLYSTALQSSSGQQRAFPMLHDDDGRRRLPLASLDRHPSWEQEFQKIFQVFKI